MSSLNDITNGLENRSPMMRAAAGPTNQPDPHAAITQELLFRVLLYIFQIARSWLGKNACLWPIWNQKQFEELKAMD